MRSLNPKGMIPELDGIRGISIILVVISHVFVSSGNSFFQKLFASIIKSGFIGVEVFFVLSGFLITRILIQKKEKPKYFYNFIIRRTLRIFPLYYLVLISLFIVFPLLYPTDQLKGFSEFYNSQWSFWIYLQNWAFPYYNQFNSFPIISHFWSLAIEEQFYLFFPAVVYFLSSKKLRWFCLISIILILSLRLVLYYGAYASEVFIQRSSITRVDNMLIGSLLASLVFDQKYHHTMIRVSKYIFSIILILTFYIYRTSFGLNISDHRIFTWGLTLMPLMFGSFIILSIGLNECSIIPRIMRSSFLRFFGKYSYSIYIIHYPLDFILNRLDILSKLSTNTIGLLNCVITIVAALLSWKFIEAPFLSLKSKFQ